MVPTEASPQIVDQLVDSLYASVLQLKIELITEVGPYEDALIHLELMATDFTHKAKGRCSLFLTQVTTGITEMRVVGDFLDNLASFHNEVTCKLQSSQANATLTAEEKKSVIDDCRMSAKRYLEEFQKLLAPRPKRRVKKEGLIKERAVVFLDQVGYTIKARKLERWLGENKPKTARVLDLFNDRMQDDITIALDAMPTDKPVGDPIIQTAGDGAVLLFDRVDQAVMFAEVLHEARFGENCDCSPDDTIAYRCTIAFGYISVKFKKSRVDSGGIPFIEAARLIAHKDNDQYHTWITGRAWEKLSEGLRRHFELNPIDVPGKHKGENYSAHKRIVTSSSKP